MTQRRTWVWVIVGLAVMMVLAIITIAGIGIYFVSQHIRADDATSADAMRAFDAERARFAPSRPLFELDAQNEPHLVRPMASLPSSEVRPSALWVLAWDPERARLARVSLPMWMLRFGKQRMSILRGERGVDLARMDLDPQELERIGPALLLDLRHRDGARVLLWTQ